MDQRRPRFSIHSQPRRLLWVPNPSMRPRPRYAEPRGWGYREHQLPHQVRPPPTEVFYGYRPPQRPQMQDYRLAPPPEWANQRPPPTPRWGYVSNGPQGPNPFGSPYPHVRPAPLLPFRNRSPLQRHRVSSQAPYPLLSPRRQRSEQAKADANAKTDRLGSPSSLIPPNGNEIDKLKLSSRVQDKVFSRPKLKSCNSSLPTLLQDETAVSQPKLRNCNSNLPTQAPGNRDDEQLQDEVVDEPILGLGDKTTNSPTQVERSDEELKEGEVFDGVPELQNLCINQLAEVYRNAAQQQEQEEVAKEPKLQNSMDQQAQESEVEVEVEPEVEIVNEPNLRSSSKSNQPAHIRRSEVEIITFKRQNGAYADNIERVVKSLGFTADQIFLSNPEMDMFPFVQGLSQNGTIFAVVIRNVNEIHRSVTAFIMTGTSEDPEEHRNLPLGMFYDKIRARFAEIEHEKFKAEKPSPEDEETLNSLQEGKFLSDAEYQNSIALVQKRWESQRKLEKRVGFDEGSGIRTKDELQRRILEIMGAADPNIIPISQRLADSDGPGSPDLDTNVKIQTCKEHCGLQSTCECKCSCWRSNVTI